MERRPTTQDPAPPDGPALGNVARNLLDHATMIVRDEIKIGRLEARRYAEHVRRDLAPRAAYVTAAASLGAVGALSLLIAVFLGIAWAIGSVAWAFAIYGVLFAVAAVVVAVLARRPPRRDEAAELARRFPAARAKASEPEHLLVAQQSRPELHRREVEEAQREAGGSGVPPRVTGLGP